MSKKKAKKQGKKAAKKVAKKYPIIFLVLVIIVVVIALVIYFYKDKIIEPKPTFEFSNLTISNLRVEDNKKLTWNSPDEENKFEILIEGEEPIIVESTTYDISLLKDKFTDNKLSATINAIKGENKGKNPLPIVITNEGEDTYSVIINYIYEGYYSGIDYNSMSDQEIMIKLREIISDVEKIPSYGEVRQIFEESDLDMDDRNHMRGIYDGAMLPAEWDGRKINREHVWPNSRLGIERVGQSERSIGSDPHNLRAITPSTNSSRSNHPFNNPTDPSMEYGIFDIDNFTWHFPSDQDKGDVARIMLYMVVRWDHLKLVEKPSGPTYEKAGAQMGNIKVLLDWHLEDPVDSFEHQRNNVIYKYQKNRNPFIDHPELFERVYNYFLQQYEKAQNDLNQYKVQLILLEKNKQIYVEFELPKEQF